jgi:site-specific recombinase XerD
MAQVALPSLSVEKEQLLADYQEYLQRWHYYLAEDKLRAAHYFLAFGSESLDELCDADVERYIRNRSGPYFYRLRTFQFFLQQYGLTEAAQPDLLTPRLASVPASTARRVRAYLETLQRRNYSPATIKSIMYLLTAFIQAISPEQQVQMKLVDRHVISAYIDSLRGRSLRGATINNHICAIRGFFRFLVDQELMEHNPVLESHYLREREDPLPQAMTAEEVHRFLAVIENKMDFAMFLLFLRSGLRVGEMASLNLGDVDLEQQSIRIERGEKNGLGRIVYFSADAKVALEEWLAQRAPFPEVVRLFFTKKTKCIQGGTINERFKRYLALAGIEKPYSAKSLRHTFATQLLNAGVPLTTLQKLLGHDRITTTQLYARLSDRTKRQNYFAAMEQVQARPDLEKEGKDD